MYLSIKRGIDMTGKTVGKLTVLGVVAKDRYGLDWECLCECGTKVIVKGIHLRGERATQSCGCIRGREVKHGMHDSPEYNSWKSMIARCTNPKATGAQNYIERGITFDPDWADFENFYRDMGPRPEGKTLDRRDNDLGYSKDNCRWATPKEQANNRRPARSKNASC